MAEVDRNTCGEPAGQEPVFQNGMAQPCQVNSFGQSVENQLNVPRPDPNLMTTDAGQGNNGPPLRFDYGPSFNGYDPNSMLMGPNCGPYVSGPAPGFPSQFRMSMEFCQMLPPHPENPDPMDARFNIATPWVYFPQMQMQMKMEQMLPFKQPPYFVGPPVQVVSFTQLVPTTMWAPQWNRFEVPKPPQRIENMNSGQESCSDDPWWGTLPTIPPQDSWDSKMARHGNVGNGYGEETLGITSAEDRFQAQLKIFTQLPMDVHKKIQEMSGSEIINYFEATVIRIRLQSIVYSQRCYVLITREPEIGQCWLTAFSIKDRYRAVMRFNRLLTRHLKVKVSGETGVGIQPSKIAENVEGEFFMFYFISASEAEYFLHVLEEARNQVWKRSKIDQNV